MNKMDQKKFFNFHHYQETACQKTENDRKRDENQPKCRHGTYLSGSFLYVNEIEFFLQIKLLFISNGTKKALVGMDLKIALFYPHPYIISVIQRNYDLWSGIWCLGGCRMVNNWYNQNLPQGIGGA